jgi:hypothetical protein
MTMDQALAEAEWDRTVRRHVYDYVMREGLPPSTAVTASTLGRSTGEVVAAFRRLADARILVLQPDGGEILMANPFSAVPTAFQVRTGGQAYFGNCIWDALGILTMLHRDGEVEASCGCCGSAMRLTVAGGALAATDGIAHFALPAVRWWDDIVFT